MLSQDTLLRGYIAKGFAAPPYLAAIVHAPDLEPETSWTYQLGIESKRLEWLTLKATLFYNDIEDGWNYSEPPWTNEDAAQQQGFEVEVQTASFYGLQVTGNFTYVHIETESSTEPSVDDETSTANLIFSYHNPTYGIRAELAGHYYRMSDAVKNEEPKDKAILWDLLLAKDFTLDALSGEVYLKGYNIFNNDLYFDLYYPNPSRWVEAGIAFSF